MLRKKIEIALNILDFSMATLHCKQPSSLIVTRCIFPVGCWDFLQFVVSGQCISLIKALEIYGSLMLNVLAMNLISHFALSVGGGLSKTVPTPRT